jgi:hypothetical protein
MLIRVLVAAFTVVFFGPAAVWAQQATVFGTVVDESKGVLPGVTVTATETATGRQVVSISSERGEYRLVGLAPGRYRIATELAGFAPTVVPDIELLVGQTAEIRFAMKLATLAENVTVTGETPLVDTRQSQVAGNVDRRQMESLPISGRNWMELSMQVKGITANAISRSSPGPARTTAFRLNLDGQEITQDRVGGFGQGGISRDAIAEYQVITNMFDVTMGRSVGIQVQAVTRAGTNNLDGSLYGYFRDDKFNAKDHFVDRVLPYSNQQVGGTVGGPIVRDRMHYFFSHEYERQPDTFIAAPAAFAPQTMEIPLLDRQYYSMGRVDYQFGAGDHVAARGNYWKRDFDHAEAHPSRVAERGNSSGFFTVNWSRVLRNNLQQELKVGHFRYRLWNYPNEPSTIEYVFPGLTVGSQWNWPSTGFQRHVSTRYDLTWNKGSHDLKLGTDLQIKRDSGVWRARERGQMFFNRLPADVATRFPLNSSPSAWDLSGLDSSVIRFDVNFARDDDWTSNVPRPAFALWLGDTWKVNNQLTLNLGVRYDVAWREFNPPGVQETDVIINNGLFTENVGYRNDIRDLNNVAPRVGFAWNVSGSNNLVIRGGAGLFHSIQGGQLTYDAQLWNGQKILVNSFPNDGRPGFTLDPTRGVTAADVFAGRVPVPPQAIQVFAHDYEAPETWQAMLGFQKQISEVFGFDADLVYNKGSHEDIVRDPNLFFDPATGLFKNPATAGRPLPQFGEIRLKTSTGYSDYLALASQLTRRYRNNFQVSVAHTLMFFKRDSGVCNQGNCSLQLNPFDLSADFARGSDFQRHTLNANGLWRLPWDIQLSGTFHYGSGTYSDVTAPVAPLASGIPRRVRADLTVIPRDTFKEDPWQSLSLRVAKDIPLFGDVRLTAMAEVFNVYNYDRYIRNQIEGHSFYGQALRAGNDPRTGQLAFRIAW